MDLLDGRDVGLTVWLLFGLVLAGVIALALFRYLGTFLFAVFLYYATRPLYRRLDEHLDHPNVAVAITLVAVALPIALVVAYAGFLALQELDQFLATHSLGHYRSYFQPYLSLAREGQLRRLWDALRTDSGQPLSPALERALGPVRNVLGLALIVLFRLFLMTVFLVYLLRDDRLLADWFYETVNYDRRIVDFASQVDDDLETVFFSNLAIIAVSAIIAGATYVGLNLVAPAGDVVTVPILLGLLTGIATLVPIVGMKLVYFPYAGYLGVLALLGAVPIWYPVAFFVAVLIVVDTVPDFFIRSYLSARSGVHMGLILLGYVLGTMVFGWMGLFLGPLVVVLAVHFGHAILPDLASHVTFS